MYFLCKAANRGHGRQRLRRKGSTVLLKSRHKTADSIYQRIIIMRIAGKAEQDIEHLATFVHGVLAGLHALGIVYNIKRRNWIDVAAHSAAMSYDMFATAKHLVALDRLTSRPRLASVDKLQSVGED